MKFTSNDQRLLAEGWWPAMYAAKRLGCHVTTLYRRIDAGKLVGKTVLGRRYVSLDSLIADLGGADTATALLAERQESS